MDSCTSLNTLRTKNLRPTCVLSRRIIWLEITSRLHSTYGRRTCPSALPTTEPPQYTSWPSSARLPRAVYW